MKSVGVVNANPSEKVRRMSDPEPAVEGKSATALADPQVDPKVTTRTLSLASAVSGASTEVFKDSSRDCAGAKRSKHRRREGKSRKPPLRMDCRGGTGRSPCHWLQERSAWQLDVRSLHRCSCQVVGCHLWCQTWDTQLLCSTMTAAQKKSNKDVCS